MRHVLIVLGWSLLALLLLECKSASKALKSGEYFDAVMMASRKLKETPGHLSSLEILSAAYPKAVDAHLGAAKRLESNASGFYWEQIVEQYDKLNRMYSSLSECTACLNKVDPKSYQAQEEKARGLAATARSAEGEKWLSQRTRESARQAYAHFDVANKMRPEDPAIVENLKTALELATFKVVVEQVLVTSRLYQLSNEYFQDRVNAFLKSDLKSYQFVSFYTPDEAEQQRVKPDQVIVLQFDDFTVGQTLLERNTETVTSKDSVKIGETKIRDKTRPVYGKVTAKFTYSKKTVVSGGVLDLTITEFGTGKKVHQDKLSGKYTWVCEWGSFSGDERALTAAQKVMVKQQELVPPAPQELFIEFSKPLYDQLTRKLRNFYRDY